MANDADEVKSAARMALGREIEPALAEAVAARAAALQAAAAAWLEPPSGAAEPAGPSPRQ